MLEKMKKRLKVEERFDPTYVYYLSKPDPDIDQYFKVEAEQHKNEFRFMVVRCNDEEHKFEFEYYHDLKELLCHYKTCKMFTKDDRSSFKYWFAHWAGFQVTALNLGIWKPKYLLHDIEKPWLKLWWKGDYKKVQKWHRTHNRHHLEYGLLNGWDKIDWVALMIDWECCGLSKQEAQLDARETMEYEIGKEKWRPYKKEIVGHLLPLLNMYKL